MKSALIKSLGMLTVILVIPSFGIAGIGITSFPYVNNFESQADVDEATHYDSECIGEISHDPAGGWNGSGAFRMRIVDHYTPQCPKNEDTAGMGTYNWASLGGQTQVNIGMLTYFGPNFYQPLDDDDVIKWVLFGVRDNGQTDGLARRPMLGLRHFGGGSQEKVFMACDDAGGNCADEFGNHYPSDHGYSPEDYSFRLADRLGEWIWIEFQSVVGGNNTVFIYTADGSLAGEYTNIPSRISLGQFIVSFNELAYWEGAQDTTEDSYVKFDRLVISNQFIGPPGEFVGGGGGALPAPSGLRILQ